MGLNKMAKKKSVKKKALAKKVPKKIIRKVKRKSKKVVGLNKKKINVALRNLILFAILFIISLVLYNMSSGKEIYENLFFILSLVFGFVVVAFLLVLLVFFFIRVLKK